ncbi:class I SAM-dependent methyltransferase [Jiangella aurantiaca]|uniref:Class I SAM-dependent methyltransferase n=1 Tax=Jiangella aurantiaca TaxID=2530373 RepID=A0A4R5A119_9ACTN|nr:class I SAM-dependent methyltransferase [Jiangella aurantiaca]TDD64314.1 class I SAM-dependent methyltransferase [Jiangella aurantiaca]
MTTTRAAWQLDEVASIGRENLDPAHVARYDDKEDAGAAREVALLESLGCGPESVVVDLGAGTGQFALAAAESFGRVVAVDPSPVMLARLRDSVRQRDSNLEVVEAGFLTYEHQGAAPDVVYSRWALHHLPDFWKSIALHRIRAMLPAGGLLRLSDVVFAFGVDEAEERIEAWCAAIGADHTEWTREDAEEHVRDEHSTYSWLLEPMIEAAGFEIRNAVYSEDRFVADYVLTAAP